MPFFTHMVKQLLLSFSLFFSLPHDYISLSGTCNSVRAVKYLR